MPINLVNQKCKIDIISLKKLQLPVIIPTNKILDNTEDFVFKSFDVQKV